MCTFLDATVVCIAARRRRAKNFGLKLKDLRFSDLGEGGWGGGGGPPRRKKLSLVDSFEKNLVPYAHRSTALTLWTPTPLRAGKR